MKLTYEVGDKWPPFRRRHFRMYFLELIFVIMNSGRDVLTNLSLLFRKRCSFSTLP